MSSSSNKRQTMAKIARERSLREKRALKLERKENRKLAAAAAAEAPDPTSAELEPSADSDAPAPAEPASP